MATDDYDFDADTPSKFNSPVNYHKVEPLSPPPENWPTVPRINRVTQAIVMGTAKGDFKFENDDEKGSWDLIADDVARAKAKGIMIDIPRELT